MDKPVLNIRSILSFLKDLVRCTSIYISVVGGGLFLSLLAMSGIGYLPYSDRPGPGWHGGAHFPSFREAGFYLSFIIFFVLISATVWGALLFLVARFLGAFHMPRWLIASEGCVLGGFVTLMSLAATGWYIALAAAPIYIGAALGALFGAALLPHYSNAKTSDSRHWWHWLTAPIPVLVIGSILVYPMLPDKDAQFLELFTVRVIANDHPTPPIGSNLNDQELEIIRLAGVAGEMHFGSSEYFGNSDLPKARAVLVFTGDLLSEVTLWQPKQTSVVYVQTASGWKMYPPNAPTTRKRIKLQHAPGEFEGVVVEIEPQIGKPSPFTWYPPIPRSKSPAN